MIRVVHYLNQFFGQLGGEDRAGVGPSVIAGPVGPGRLLEMALAGQGTVVATVVCGDNYVAERLPGAVDEILALIGAARPDLVVAGPAFNAGRYGLACGEVAARAGAELGVPALTGMFPENPGVEATRRRAWIVLTAASAAGMGDAVTRMVRLGLRLARGERIGGPAEGGYLPHGVRTNALAAEPAAHRAVDMLLRKLRGEPFESEIPFPVVDAVPPAPPVADLSRAKIAVVTEGGLFPRGNPDRVESARATRWGRYDVAALERLDPAAFQSIHRGFDTATINADPNRLVPLDVLRALEREGGFGALAPAYFATTGVATTVESGRRMGRAIAEALKEEQVNGVILTAT